jgi:Dimerisation domain
MKLKPAPDDLLERIGLALNLAPLPGAYAMYGMVAGRVVGVAQRLGVFAKLLESPATAARVAEQLELQVAGTRLLCENLAGLGVLEQDGHTFSVAKSARKWLDPASETYIGTWLEHTTTYWEWYADLERIVRDGGSFEIHREPAEEEEYWRVYITGQYELARLSASEVAKAIELPAHPRALLDVAGAHGWFSAELCRRHDGLHATVLDLPGSARVGREIIAKARMSDRVEHRRHVRVRARRSL